MTRKNWAELRNRVKVKRYANAFAPLILVLLMFDGKGVDASAQGVKLNLNESVSSIVILPPLVEFISMESDEPIEVSRADKGILSKEIAQAFADYLTKQRTTVRRIGIEDLQLLSHETSPKLLFEIARGKDDSDKANQIRSTIAESYPNDNYLFIRSRFYLSYWGRSSQGWRVANTIVNGGMPGKRMVIDARLYSQKDFSELWRGLAQESVTPSKSQKGLKRAIQVLGDEIVSRESTQTGKDNE